MLKKYSCIQSLLFYKFLATMSGASNAMFASRSISKNVCLQPTNKVKVLAFDFDKTCTTKVVINIYKARADYHSNKEFLDKEWAKIEQSYGSIMKDILKPLRETKPPATQFDEDGLRHFLTEVGNGDSKAIDELISSNLLQGVTEKGVLDLAQKVDLMPNLLTVLQSLKTLGLLFHVISLNFSEKLIDDVLNREGSLPTEIHTNKMQFSNGISTGHIDKAFVTASDKEVQLGKIIENADNCGLAIYVGDSFTDLLALLKADVGIIIGHSKSMLKVCNDFGIRVVPLNEWSSEKFKNELEKVLFSVSTWDEIQNFIFSDL